MAQLSRFAVLAGNHLREHRPRMYRELQQSGQLEAFLRQRAEAAQKILGDMVEAGSQYHEAWEVAKDEIYLPTEQDVPNL